MNIKIIVKMIQSNEKLLLAAFEEKSKFEWNSYWFGAAMYNSLETSFSYKTSVQLVQ